MGSAAPSMDACIWLIGSREDLPHCSLQREGRAVSHHPTRSSLRVSRTRHCCVTLKAWWPEGGGCLLCQSDKARLALFIPLQGQFAVCDLSKGNVTWQELLTSEKHLGGFWRYGPFLQFIYLSSIKWTSPLFSVLFVCLWGPRGFMRTSQSLLSWTNGVISWFHFQRNWRQDDTRENCQYKSWGGIRPLYLI